MTCARGHKSREIMVKFGVGEREAGVTCTPSTRSGPPADAIPHINLPRISTSWLPPPSHKLPLQQNVKRNRAITSSHFPPFKREHSSRKIDPKNKRWELPMAYSRDPNDNSGLTGKSPPRDNRVIIIDLSLAKKKSPYFLLCLFKDPKQYGSIL